MFQTIRSWPVLILGPKVTPPAHVSIQVAQLNTHTQHSEESSVKLGDTRHCLSLVNEKSFPSALVDILNLEVNKQDQIFSWVQILQYSGKQVW